MSFATEKELIELAEERNDAINAGNKIAIVLAFSLAANFAFAMHHLEDSCKVNIKPRLPAATNDLTVRALLALIIPSLMMAFL